MRKVTIVSVTMCLYLLFASIQAAAEVVIDGIDYGTYYDLLSGDPLLDVYWIEVINDGLFTQHGSGYDVARLDINTRGEFRQNAGTGKIHDRMMLGSSSLGRYYIDNGTLEAEDIYIFEGGSFHHATFGNVTVHNEFIIHGGDYDLMGGNLEAPFFVVRSSLDGESEGSCDQWGGLVTVDDLIVGKAEYHLWTSGTIRAKNFGVTDNGFFYQSSGENIVEDQFTIGCDCGDELISGHYTLEFGLLETRREIIVANSSFQNLGGVNNVAEDFVLYKGARYELGGYDPDWMPALQVDGDEDINQDGHMWQRDSNSLNSVGGSLVLNPGGNYEFFDGRLEVAGNIDAVGAPISIGLSSGIIQYGGYSQVRANVRVGVLGRGAYSLEGGQSRILGQLFIGVAPSSFGGYFLVDGELRAQNEVVGWEGKGHLTQEGGTNEIDNNLYIGDQLGSSGTYNLGLTGTLSVGGDEYVGLSGDAIFNQYGGTHTVTGTLFCDLLGAATANPATFNLEGGSLTVWDLAVGQDCVFNHLDGDLTILNDTTLTIKTGGVYNWEGGKLSVETINNSGTFNVSGTSGEVRYVNRLILAPDSTLNVSGITLYYNELLNNGGTINTSDGGVVEPTPGDNSPPVADAGPDQDVDADSACTANVILDGSGSTDPDSTSGTNDDIVSFEWFEDGTFLGNGETLDYTFPFGVHTINLVVTDSEGETASDGVVITVEDTTPPELSVTIDPDTLWPPNHKMVLCTPTITVSDNCEPNPTVLLLSVTSNESEEAYTYDPAFDMDTSEGHTSDDIQIVNDDIYLRAERSGKGDGRIYTIIYSATDASGNTTYADVTVTVPHDQR